MKAATGIVCTLATDAENVFTVLTARQMNESIYIVSKAVEPTAHNKLMKAGANNTISPSEIGGQRIAALLIRPAVISFPDVITRAGDVTLDLEEVSIPEQSPVNGKKLAEVRIPERTGLIILALKRKGDATFKFNPGSTEELRSGDTMVVLGTQEQARLLNDMVADKHKKSDTHTPKPDGKGASSIMALCIRKMNIANRSFCRRRFLRRRSVFGVCSTLQRSRLGARRAN
ncbi:MAG: NAD-binding protein [Eubacteriales bacterium]|nr:NAD-binding protein [Eubacteriales bacterium]